jgi:hypothetical protein
MLNWPNIEQRNVKFYNIERHECPTSNVEHQTSNLYRWNQNLDVYS